MRGIGVSISKDMQREFALFGSSRVESIRETYKGELGSILIALNQMGLLPFNAMQGACSETKDGRVERRAFVDFFCSARIALRLADELSMMGYMTVLQSLDDSSSSSVAKIPVVCEVYSVEGVKRLGLISSTCDIAFDYFEGEPAVNIVLRHPL